MVFHGVILLYSDLIYIFSILRTREISDSEKSKVFLCHISPFEVTLSFYRKGGYFGDVKYSFSKTRRGDIVWDIAYCRIQITIREHIELRTKRKVIN